jgi:high-affinity Fe2+/Pb2+ permease
MPNVLACASLYELPVDAELTFTGIGYGIIGLLWITALALLWISMRKERRYGQPLKRLITITVTIIGLCVFVFLSIAYVKTRSLEKVSHRVEPVTVKDELRP